MKQGEHESVSTAGAGGREIGNEAFGGGDLWIGQHASDRDILVFDPTRADPRGDVLALYSLTQHRMRRFPRETVLSRITPITDARGRKRAARDYEQRGELRAEHDRARETARSENVERQRESVIAAHGRYLQGLGIADEGVRDTPADHRPGRRSKCHACGTVLDDFAGSVCIVCEGILCSCGACACGQQARRR